MRKFKLHLLFGAVVVLLFLLCGWLVTAESSPLSDYFLYNIALPNLWRRLNLAPAFVGLILSGNVHQPSPVGYFAGAIVQWFIVGFVASFTARSLRSSWS